MPLNQNLRKNSHVLWTISLIQDQNPEAQTKAEFAEMVDDVVATENIGHITLCLADDLQRFRFMIKEGLNEEEAMKKCQEMAQKWHQDNAASLQKLKENKKFSLLTWKEFLAWPDYQNTVKSIEKWYKVGQDRKFRHDADGKIQQVLQQIPPDAKISNPSEQTKLMMQYLFEECAFQKFAADSRFIYELYKTPTNKCMRRVKYNSEYVPLGYMLEIYFTQFNPSTKKQQTNQANCLFSSPSENLFSLPLTQTHDPASPSKSSAFLPMFANHTPKKHQKPIENFYQESEVKSPGRKIAEFIEKTIELLPPEQQDQAAKDLIEFTTQKIIPLYYLDVKTAVKI